MDRCSRLTLVHHPFPSHLGEIVSFENALMGTGLPVNLQSASQLPVPEAGAHLYLASTRPHPSNNRERILRRSEWIQSAADVGQPELKLLLHSSLW
ncbi:uncharacterized protein PHALS_04017 [Plasmopara halstedii]|uniref:Uncharacterized protein n=1 Tax=Plasmopara halstedii TaxID=4781 RepID=A0A0P1A8Q5_PLAHL|nr:uncharacterized protein PHALS_04017 [Plasmopara halstedii]CEG36768.1 hypothetical protein PHALS_04017 [Plasmopara halstedii]|eukprot:XP_024573137.1 hypothetical protein PHALS_04017 [Plasmopara halstedii]